MDFEQAGELKIGQVGIANLRIRTLDVERLTREMHDRVARAPKLFGRAAVILDFGGLSQIPDVATAKALLDGLRSAGVLPVALAYGTTETELLSQQLGLPLLAKFRAQYEHAFAVEFFRLAQRAENPEIRRRVGAGVSTSAPRPVLISMAPCLSVARLVALIRCLLSAVSGPGTGL